MKWKPKQPFCIYEEEYEIEFDPSQVWEEVRRYQCMVDYHWDIFIKCGFVTVMLPDYRIESAFEQIETEDGDQ